MNIQKYLIILLVPVIAIVVYKNISQASFCANSISCVKNMSVDIENDAVGVFNGQKVVPPKIDPNDEGKKVLSDETATGTKHIYVDLSKQTLYAYQGDSLYFQAFVSTGKWHPTPTGDFTIWTKLLATRMTGGEGADFYDLPNVPYVMFFANNQVPEGMGFSLHGAYWHDNFGHPMSHGCVNMRIVDAKKLFEWVDDPNLVKTTVTIYGQAPI